MALQYLARHWCLAIWLLVFPSPASTQPSTGGSFFDGFDSLDETRWLISDGWVNGSWQNCVWSRKSVIVQDGLLELQFAREKSDKRDYRCGEIQTRRFFGFGTYEARYRATVAPGLNAAFFTYTGPPHGNPHDEIDVEILTYDTSSVSLNTYVNGRAGNGMRVDLPKSADLEYSTFSFTWRPDGIEWFIDGKSVHKTAPGSLLPSTPQKIFASFWGSDTFSEWLSEFQDPGKALTIHFDWIAFTALGEECQFDASVLCEQY